MGPNNWPLHWPFGSDFFTEGVVFHDQLGNVEKAQTKIGAIYVSPRIVAELVETEVGISKTANYNSSLIRMIDT